MSGLSEALGMSGNGRSQRIVTILIALLGIITTVVCGMIPWAFSIHGRLASIEATLKQPQRPPEYIEKQIQDSAARLNALELKLTQVEIELQHLKAQWDEEK